MTMKLDLVTALFAAGLVAAFTAAPAAAQDGPATEAFAAKGAESCMECHDKPPVTLILSTPHAQAGDSRTPFAAQECEACHGASPEHMRKVSGQTTPPPPKVVFGKGSATPVAEQNAVCMGCHEGGIRMHWAGSQHNSADLSCASCHSVHTTHDPVLTKATQSETCYGCHAEQRAQERRRSRHPIREGKVACSDCHNPHGSFGPKLLQEASVNDTCYGCHAEKRGPFLWEHAPVRDDCTICHTPHGSNQQRLLNVRTPYLCQQCHQETFHPSTLYSGANLPPGSGERLLAKGCLNCHTQIHGSNHPSGARLTR